jgi:hypothetical protein
MTEEVDEETKTVMHIRLMENTEKYVRDIVIELLKESDSVGEDIYDGLIETMRDHRLDSKGLHTGTLAATIGRELLNSADFKLFIRNDIARMLMKSPLKACRQVGEAVVSDWPHDPVTGEPEPLGDIR